MTDQPFDLLTSPKLPEKIQLLRKRWLELYREERDIRDAPFTPAAYHLGWRAVERRKAAVLDAVREFFCEEMGGGK